MTKPRGFEVFILNSSISKRIATHHGAELRNNHWVCVCGMDLELKESIGLSGPDTKEIIHAWAGHCGRVVGDFVNRRMTVEVGKVVSGR